MLPRDAPLRSPGAAERGGPDLAPPPRERASPGAGAVTAAAERPAGAGGVEARGRQLAAVQRGGPPAAASPSKRAAVAVQQRAAGGA